MTLAETIVYFMLLQEEAEKMYKEAQTEYYKGFQMGRIRTYQQIIESLNEIVVN